MGRKKKSDRSNSGQADTQPEVEPVLLYTGEYQDIAIVLISPNDFNPRKSFDESELNSLAESIKTHGVINPITVRPWRPEGTPDANPALYQIVAGERRWRAAKLAGLHSIPAVVRKCNDSTAKTIALIENTNREQLKPTEVIDAYTDLNKSHSPKQIAKLTGQSGTTVARYLSLARSPAVLRMAMDSGKISLATAGEVCRVRGDESIVLAAKCAITGLSRPEIAGLTDEDCLDPSRDWVPMKGDECRLFVAQNFQIDLVRAMFELDQVDIVAGTPACTECPKNTNNLAKKDAEFAEFKKAEGPFCMDVTCYRSKQRVAVIDRAKRVAKKTKIAFVEWESVPFVEASHGDGQYYIHYTSRWIDLAMPINHEGGFTTIRDSLGDDTLKEAIVTSTNRNEDFAVTYNPGLLTIVELISRECLQRLRDDGLNPAPTSERSEHDETHCDVPVNRASTDERADTSREKSESKANAKPTVCESEAKPSIQPDRNRARLATIESAVVSIIAAIISDSNPNYMTSENGSLTQVRSFLKYLKAKHSINLDFEGEADDHELATLAIAIPAIQAIRDEHAIDPDRPIRLPSWVYDTTGEPMWVAIQEAIDRELSKDEQQ